MRTDDTVWIAGQVAKNNRSGELTAARDLVSHLRMALGNVIDALRAAGGDAADLCYLQAHVVGDVRSALVFLHDQVAATTVVAAVGVHALSHPDYQVELSAVAVLDAGRHVTRQKSPGAVRSGDQVFVGGAAGATFAEALEGFASALESAGACLMDTVWTHIFCVEPIDFEDLSRAHRSAFGASPPAATLILVRELPETHARVLLSGAAFVAR